ncbi:MAG: DNA translocase FtsK 4TM domain-containing protein, partial [Planctomycetota bacterium]|nr:DNA translocase FtsK 4TM domain-containing protein [Planctomycetota bacterium]
MGASKGRPDAERWREIGGLALTAMGIFLTISAISYRWSSADNPLLTGVQDNWGGAVGWHLGGFFVENVGLACYPFFGFVIHWGLLLLLRRPLDGVWRRVAGACALMLVFAVFLAGPSLRGAGPCTPFGFGGGLGMELGPKLWLSFGGVGVIVLLGVTGAIAFLIATDWPLHALVREFRVAERDARDKPGRGLADSRVALAFKAAGRSLAELFRQAEPEADTEVRVVKPRREKKSAPEPERQSASKAGPEPEAEPHPAKRRRGPVARPEPRPKRVEQKLLPIPIVGTPAAQARRRGEKASGDYVYPPLDLLEPTAVGDAIDEGALRVAAQAIESRLQSHGVGAKIVCISSGPAVTVFEVELEEGLRVTTMNKFGPDLAAALKAYSVRIVAPIPGKHTVGVEVPNPSRTVVRLRELVELREQGGTKETVPLFLGRDVAGHALIEDLARMPHLLIAGATGSGKSVCINSVLLSTILMKSPDDVRLIMIDPKMVELQHFKGIPHLLCPIVTSMKRAAQVLDWSVETMEQRYALLSRAGVRNIADYNNLGEDKLRKRLGDKFDPEQTPVKLPAIVMIIDEFADLMAVAGADVELSIQRLAQKSRAVGLHVILATQRPSRDVITGLIKANLPTRIGFQVSSRVDSRVVLDSNGAEQLLGHGDMLYIRPGTHRLIRAQGTFVSDDEIHDV